jgi:Na+-transporting methylmalonyl-CoA/oxaloacetate decarboxylase beta subunit
MHPLWRNNIDILVGACYGPNVAGTLGSAVTAGILSALVG